MNSNKTCVLYVNFVLVQKLSPDILIDYFKLIFMRDFIYQSIVYKPQYYYYNYYFVTYQADNF